MNEMYYYAFGMALVMALSNAPLWASEADDKIKTSFESSYVYNRYLKDDAIKTEVKDSVVTLTGTVEAEYHKTLAEETVGGQPGVTRVDNQLVTTAEVDADNDDVWIGRKIKLTLLFHRNVDAGNTIISVKDGVVTLKGEALNQAQKELTAEYAKDIDGVKEVKVEMTLAPAPKPGEQTAGEKLDDASVKAQVKMALLTHRSTSAVTTKVETHDGEVTITGIAKNDAEKSLVTKLVSDIHGVLDVKNLMTVAEVK
jgi:osmotically-inducible protein OsmY